MIRAEPRAALPLRHRPIDGSYPFLTHRTVAQIQAAFGRHDPAAKPTPSETPQ